MSKQTLGVSNINFSPKVETINLKRHHSTAQIRKIIILV
jgi:hypothetical protein